MPERVRVLKKKAMEGVEWRNHVMPYKWEKLSSTCFMKECKICGKAVVVDSKPAPNGIDIGGEAVALTCPVKDPILRASLMDK